MKNIALFASGNGTNVQRIAEYFKDNKDVRVSVVIVNKKDAYARERAKDMGIDDIYFNRNDFYNTDNVLEELKRRDIDMIVLAGFLWLIPYNLIQNFPNAIINIHPALLPKYGGKGMYGNFVHQQVVQNKEKESGITIHFVNAEYDDGAIIFQAKCEVDEKDTAEDVANKVHELEYKHFPLVIENLIFSR